MATKSIVTSSKNVREVDGHPGLLSLYVHGTGSVLLPKDAMGGYVDAGKDAEGNAKTPAAILTIGDGQGPFSVSPGKGKKPTYVSSEQLSNMVNSRNGYGQARTAEMVAAAKDGKVFTSPELKGKTSKKPFEVDGKLTGVDTKTGEEKTVDMGTVSTWATTENAAVKHVKETRNVHPRGMENVTSDLSAHPAELTVPAVKEARVKAAEAPEVSADAPQAEVALGE